MKLHGIVTLSVTKVTTKAIKFSQRGIIKTFTNYFVSNVKLAELYRPQSNNTGRLYRQDKEHNERRY